MKVWISRDKDFEAEICIWNAKPKGLSQNRFIAGEQAKVLLIFTSHDSARQIPGLTLRKGTCKQYELTLKGIK